ncbi:hypothetical protein ES703_103568 [subsurface metagenome]
MSLVFKIYEAFKDDEAKAKALSEVIDDLDRRIVPMEQISTKGDLEVTRLTLQKEIEIVRKEIAEVKSGIIKWVIGLLLVQTGVIVTIITLLR